MSKTMPSSSNEWLQYYQQTAASRPAVPNSGYSDATAITTSVTVDQTLSPTNSSANGGGQFNLIPKANVSKPIRRRSRASKRTPTTLLNASATNFRALVQHFTGCSSRQPSLSFGTHRGPLNLNFGPASENHGLATTSTMAPFGYSNNYYNHQNQNQGDQTYNQNHEKQEYYMQQRQNEYTYQEQQSMFSLNNSASDNSRTHIQTLDDFMMETSSLHDIGGFTSSNGPGHDQFFRED